MINRLSTIFFCLTVIAALLLGASRIHAQACDGGEHPPPINTGTEFLVCYMQNANFMLDQTPTAFDDLFLGTLEDSAIITVTCKAIPSYLFSITLPPHSSVTHRITKDPAVNFPAHDPWIESDEKIDNTVFCVKASAPIFCYGLNEKQFTADAFLAYPKNVASTEYRVMSFFSSNLLGEQHPSEFCVASFDDSNTVWIIPSAMTADSVKAGDTEIFVLGGCQCIQVQALLDPDSSRQRARRDLTGSIVRSSKPVVVYGGNSRTEAPSGFVTANGLTTTDHLAEAIPPVADWGKSFIVKNFGRKPGDIMRVLAYNANTIVKINGNVWGAPLAANAFRDTMIRQSDTMTNNIFTVESLNNPILVGMIAHTAPADDDPTGDPFLAIVPPLDQLHNDYTYFIVPDNVDYNPNDQFLIITADEASIGNITVDGSPVTTPFTPITVGGHNYGIVTIPQAGGPHRILSPSPPNNGFTILAYGWGDKISYGYTAGMKFIPKTGMMSLPPANPGIAPRGGGFRGSQSSEIIARNILNERIYFDSAKINYISNEHSNPIHLSKNMIDIGAIEMGEQKTLELEAANPIENIITGNVRIWYHSSLWNDMDPVDFPFTFTPASTAAAVNAAKPNQTVILENYPNPAIGKTTVHFSIPSPAYASVKIYDALGRTIRTVYQGITVADKTIQISTQDMTPGEYTLELLVPELGINKHGHLVVIQ